MCKKLLSLALVLALLLVCLSGCGSPAASSASASAPASSGESVTEVPVEEPEAPAAPEEVSALEAEVSAEEPVEEAAPIMLGSIARSAYTEISMPLTEESVTMTAWDYVVPPVGAVIADLGTEATLFSQLQERSGITFKFTTANLLTANDSIALMVAANEMPDIVFDFTKFYSGNLDQLVEDDLIVDLAEYQDLMPNYFDTIQSNENISRDIYTENGHIAAANSIKMTLYPSSGPVIRQDYLDQLNLDQPVTFADYTNVLAAIWWTSTMALNTLSAYEECDVEPITPPVVNDGDELHFDDRGSSYLGAGAIVACTCPEIELAVQLLDYCYSEAGILLANYGTEGESFTFNADGEPELTDLVIHNPDGLDFSIAVIKFTSNSDFCSILDPARNTLAYTDAQLKSLDLWVADGDSHLAPGSEWNTDDQTEYSTLMSDVTTYCGTQIMQFVIGDQPMSEWDSFLSNLEASFGSDIDRATELFQNAIDAYLAK